MLLTNIILLVLIGISKAFLDYYSEPNSFINTDKEDSWKNKWLLDAKGNLIDNPKYLKHKDRFYSVLIPKYKEAFLFSSTIFVFVTDKWHLWQFIFLRLIYILIALNVTMFNIVEFLLLVFAILPALVGVPFQIVYAKLNKNV